MLRGRGFSILSRLALGLLALSGCGGDDGDEAPKCLDQIDAQCAEAYDPTWDRVYEFTIAPSCGAAGVSCHGRDGMKGGLGLFSPDAAYAGLVGGEGGAPRVKPGDPACSSLMERLTTSDPERRMPLGSSEPLSARHICAIQKWIAKGANP